MSTAVGIDMTRVNEFIKIKERREELKREDEALSKRYHEIESELLENFSEQEVPVSSLSVGPKTVFINRQLFAAAKDKNQTALLEALKRVQPELVKESVNHQTLCSYCREITEGGERPLPDYLADVVELKEVFSLRVRSNAK